MLLLLSCNVYVFVLEKYETIHGNSYSCIYVASVLQKKLMQYHNIKSDSDL